MASRIEGKNDLETHSCTQGHFIMTKMTLETTGKHDVFKDWYYVNGYLFILGENKLLTIISTKFHSRFKYDRYNDKASRTAMSNRTFHDDENVIYLHCSIW